MYETKSVTREYSNAAAGSLGASGNGTAMAPRQKEVSEALDSLDKTIEAANNMLCELEQRLSPVVHIAPETASASEPRRQLCPLANSLTLSQERVGGMHARLCQLLQRLEL